MVGIRLARCPRLSHLLAGQEEGEHVTDVLVGVGDVGDVACAAADDVLALREQIRQAALPILGR